MSGQNRGRVKLRRQHGATVEAVGGGGNGLVQNWNEERRVGERLRVSVMSEMVEVRGQNLAGSRNRALEQILNT